MERCSCTIVILLSGSVDCLPNASTAARRTDHCESSSRATIALEISSGKVDCLSNARTAACRTDGSDCVVTMRTATSTVTCCSGQRGGWSSVGRETGTDTRSGSPLCPDSLERRLCDARQPTRIRAPAHRTKQLPSSWPIASVSRTCSLALQRISPNLLEHVIQATEITISSFRQTMPHITFTFRISGRTRYRPVRIYSSMQFKSLRSLFHRFDRRGHTLHSHLVLPVGPENTLFESTRVYNSSH